MIKTGECFWVDEFDNLWLSISYLGDGGVTSTTMVLVRENFHSEIQ